eukprot:g12765.t1
MDLPGEELMNQRHCPVKDGFSILCAVDEDCTCANSSHLRELVNVTVDGLACYACEPRRPPACTECECGNSRTHVKHAATTVDGSPCFYCEPIGGGFGQPIILPLSGVLLLVIWHFGRTKGAEKAKPVRGSLRLSRRQGDRSRAIRVQQEPLKFYEEVLLTIGDAFDFLVDAACELLGMAWQLLKKVDLLRQVPQHLTSEWYRKKLDLEEKENEQRGKKEAKASKLPKDLKECRRSEVREVAGQYLKTNVQQAVVKVPSNSNAGSGPKIKPSEVKEVVKVPSNSGRGPKTKLSQEGKVAQVANAKSVMIRAITDSSSRRAFAERLGVGRLKHIDIKYLWMQLEVKKETMVMDGIPTLLNVADLGTKRLTRQRREFLMHLIGIMEMNAEGKDEVFSKVGEDTFHQELEKKMLAKQMKEVKKQMIQTVVEEKSSWGIKIPTALVRAVTLLLLQQKVGGERIEEAADNKMPEEPYSWWFIIKLLTIYTIFVFLYGVYCGYRYRVKWSVYLRTLLRFLRQEETMEFQRQQDEFAEIGMIMRARLAANRGEWNLVRRGRNLPAPLQRPEGEVPENERPEEEATTTPEQDRRGDPSPVAEEADESEPDEEMSDGVTP